MSSTFSPSRGTCTRASLFRRTHGLPAFVILGACAALVGCGRSVGSPVTPAGPVTPAAPSLSSGPNTLTFPASTGTVHGLLLQSSTSGAISAASATPVSIYVCQGTALNATAHTGECPSDGQNSDPSTTNTASVGYDSVVQTSPTQVTATAVATSASGSSYSISDVYAPAGSAMFSLNRTVTVTSLGSGSTTDTGFNSQFSLGFSGGPAAVANYHFLAPSVVYDQNALAPGNAIAADLAGSSARWFYWRETRSGLPFVMMQDGATGSVLSLERTGPTANGSVTVQSGAAEGSGAWIVDPSIQYGSLGIQKSPQSGQANPQLTLGVLYPAEEGDVNYVLAGSNPNMWSRRSHPVYQGFSDSYTVTFGLARYADATGAADYATAFSQTFRSFYDLLPPAIAPDNAAAFYQAGIDLSKQLYSQQGNGNGQLYPGLPFKEEVDGTGAGYSYEMGFTGGQIPDGFQLLWSGVKNNDPVALSEGTAILDFWANVDPPAMASSGSQNLPLTWFEPNHSVQWSNVGCTVTPTSSQRPIFLRELSDGMESLVRAAVFARQTPAIGGRKNWEAFANQYGSWLLAHQDATGTATNGSFLRWFDPTNGQPCPSGPNNYVQSANATTFPIRFLVQMYFATGDPRYAAAARAAGAYALPNIFKPMAFTGGILINVQDREAGAQALHAALALYDLEYAQDPNGSAAAQWLQQAKIAADYLMTWQYSYNIRITDSTPNHAFAANVSAGSRSASLSNLGSSTGGAYLGIESYDLFRLHLLADDASQHYLRFSQQLEYNSVLATQLASVGQSFGFKYDGLLSEAITLAQMNFTPSSPPLVDWLSWLTPNQIDPVQQLDDSFGSPSINTLNQQNQPSLQQKNHALYPPPGTIGWGK